MKSKRRSFTREFKRETARLAVESGESLCQALRKPGIRDTVFGRWKKEFESDRERSFPGKGHLSPEDEELRRLRRENARLRMERDILKKAAVISNILGAEAKVRLSSFLIVPGIIAMSPEWTEPG